MITPKSAKSFEGGKKIPDCQDGFVLISIMLFLSVFLTLFAAYSLSSNIELMPSMMVSYNPAAPLDMDMNVNLIFKKIFWVGSTYRLGDSFDFLSGIEFGNGMRLGVAVDATHSELKKATNGSWEIMMGYTFRCKSCEVSHLRFF